MGLEPGGEMADEDREYERGLCLERPSEDDRPLSPVPMSCESEGRIVSAEMQWWKSTGTSGTRGVETLLPSKGSGKTLKRKSWSLSGVGTGVESSYSVDGIISRQGDVENIRMLEVLASPEPRQDSEFQVGPVEVRKSGSDSAVGGDGGE